MNKFINTLLLTCAALMLVSCGNDGDAEVGSKSGRSYQYFPNMYQSEGYEAYQEAEVFPGNVEAQKPVDGTVSRGWMPYEYEDTNEGYASAKANLENPVPLTEAHLTNGQALYGIYCAICHGNKGDGQGHLVTTEKILGIPSYADREITEGSIYHVMYYGINYMGSYAAQTSIEERWEIAHYVEALRADLTGTPRRTVIDEEGTVMVPETPAGAEDEAETMEPTDSDSEVEQTDPAQPNDIEEMNASDQDVDQDENEQENDGE